jgi:hypothetical protein
VTGAERICPECGGAMEAGFVLDIGYGTSMMARWVQGSADMKWYGSVDLSGRDCRKVTSYRCGGCGLLKSYAIEPANPPGLLRP